MKNPGVTAGTPAPASTKPVRVAAIGDALVESPLVSRRTEKAHIRGYRTNSAVHWMRTLAPQIEVLDRHVLGVDGDTSVATAGRIAAISALKDDIDAVVICVGLQDCFDAIKGTAPTPQATIGALERIVEAVQEAGIKAVVVIPPPCQEFSNGLFADRYLAIAATLRRIARQKPDMVLIDPTDQFKARTAFGVEPDPALVSGDKAGRPNTNGALALGRMLAAAILSAYPLAPATAGWSARQAADALNRNPLLTGAGGEITGPSGKGKVPSGLKLDTSAAAGIRAFADVHALSGTRSPFRVSLYGRYSSNWPFVKISETLAAEALKDIQPGDTIEALCEYELRNTTRNVALLALQMTAAWSKDYIGLVSADYVGQSASLGPHSAVARTPLFVVPDDLTQLALSLTIHFTPGDNQDADASLELRSIIVRKV